jgi:hypothetical protein
MTRSAANDAFRAILGAATYVPTIRVGLEHEYQVWNADRQIDFRDLIHGLPIDGSRLDPGDYHAYRLSNGAVLTSDDAEAEFASPPVTLRAGFAGELVAWAHLGRNTISAILPEDIGLRGYSTHLSVSTDDTLVDAVAALYARAFAPALMLIMDAPDGLGVYVRPRPGRLEFCSTYCDGSRLWASAVFAAGSVLACVRAIEAGEARSLTTLDVNVVPATGRFGFYVGRNTSFGFDLYGADGSAPLALEGGGACSRQQYLRVAWEAASEALGALADPRDLGPEDEFVAHSLLAGEVSRSAVLVSRTPVYGEAIRIRQRPGYIVEPIHATWAFTVFRATADKTAYLSIPSSKLAPFFEQLEAGALDSVIHDYLDGVPVGRILETNKQTLEPGLWDEVPSPQALLPAERSANGDVDPFRPDVKQGRMGKIAGRPGKIAGRPGKPLVITAPALPPVPVSSVPAPRAPVPPVQTPSRSSPEPAGGRPSTPLVLLGSLLAAVLVLALLSVAGVFGENSTQSQAETATPTSAATGTPTVVSTQTPLPSATSAAVIRPRRWFPVKPLCRRQRPRVSSTRRRLRQRPLRWRLQRHPLPGRLEQPL